tara:strand:+ start:407 stop:661 length:255 start_codon:yes stop_codon:yes gene_type:complete
MQLESLLKTIAAQLIAFDDSEVAAKYIYDKIEESIGDESVSSKERMSFWESVIRQLTKIDEKYSAEVAAKYLDMVIDSYGQSSL